MDFAPEMWVESEVNVVLGGLATENEFFLVDKVFFVKTAVWLFLERANVGCQVVEFWTVASFDFEF